MRNSEHTLRVYEDLAQWYDRQGQAKLRDWFLVLAADAALSAGRPSDAERLRGRLLQVNPHHLLKPFDSFADALKSPDVQGYVADLRRIYPPELAAQLLQEQRQGGGEAANETLPGPSVKGPVPGPGGREEPEVQVYRVEAVPSEPRPPARPSAGPAPPPPIRPLPRPTTSAPMPPERPAPARTVPPPERTPPPRQVPPPEPPAPVRTASPPTPPPRSRPAGPAPSPWTVPPLPESEPAPPAGDADADPTSRWVSLSLFVVLLVAGLALLAYVLARPFLPTDLF